MKKLMKILMFSVLFINLYSDELLKNLVDHGVAVPFSTHRGIVATKGENENNVVCVWLHDHRGCYGLLYINVDTEESETFEIPFNAGGDSPFASILSSNNRFYSHFGGYFVEFDPVKKSYTFFKKTYPKMAMSMTEDDNGNIWSVTYPDAGLVCYNPKTKEFFDYGPLKKENWAQYPRYIAVDDKNWVYVGIGYTRSNIIAFNPQTKQIKYMLEENEREQGGASLFRATDGKVYGVPSSGKKDNWYEFYNGEKRRIGALPSEIKSKKYISGSQTLFHKVFPDGKIIKDLDLTERILIIEEPKTKEELKIKFDYKTEGAHIMGITVSPDGTICGGTAFPFYFFKYDPKTDNWTRYPCYGQWNTIDTADKKVFVGGYTGGFLLEYDPFLPWKGTTKNDENSNPKYITESSPDINRPHDLLPYNNGKILILAGTPAYGYTGGGLLFWDRETKVKTLIRHTDILPFHSTMSIVQLKNNKILCGTTTSPGTGGEKKVNLAELYIMDINTKKIIWHSPVLEEVENYNDLFYDEERQLVYGFADQKIFFVFDPEAKKIIFKCNTDKDFGSSVYAQGSKIFVFTPEKELYILFKNWITKFDRENFKFIPIAKVPNISNGAGYLNGRIYFVSSSHLYSVTIPK